MLRISGLVKKTPFIFTELDGKDHELEVTEFTILDNKKLVGLQKPILDDKELPEGKRIDLLMCARVICSVKVQATGEYYWNAIKDLTDKPYPTGLGSSLYDEMDKLNPISVDTVDEKKSES